MKREADVKKAVKAHLNRLGAWHTSPFQAGMSVGGVPDILCCVAGVFVGIECKFGRNKPSALQSMQIQKIRAAGGYAIVCNDRNITAVLEWLTALASAAGEGLGRLPGPPADSSP